MVEDEDRRERTSRSDPKVEENEEFKQKKLKQE